MEEGVPHNMDRKGKGKMEYSNVVDKGESSKKKDSEGNQNIVHEGSLSSVQENETAPVALPESVIQNKENVVETDDTNVSISPTVAEDQVSSPPQVKEGTSLSPNWRSGTALDGHGTVAEYNVLEIGESSKKKDSDENQIVTYQGSSSSVQENEIAPVALRDFVDVLPLPQVEEGTSSSPNWSSGPALGGHGTEAEYDVLEKRKSSKIKDSEGNQMVTHKGSSSFVQENHTAPMALPVLETNVTNVSISPPVAEEVVLPPPQVEQRTSSSSNRRSTVSRGRHHQPRARSRRYTNFRLPGHRTLAAHRILPPLQVGEGSSSSPNQRSNRTLCQCRYCTVTLAEYWALVNHENSHSEEHHRRRGSTQYINYNPGCTTPMTPRLTKQERNDGSIDLLSWVGTSSSMESQDHDGDHDHDHNNEENDGAHDLLLQVGRKPS
ncbi:hypothetical protein L2E82_17346 [Cichorium intybus]|uniref:Uncharacterized protein n=1 Tax=Cichorium intybus TaxID=13427 RepID=A0ACB9F817_CICIN|nr:hypothetical protein L2E82_17346 [Cichorium intybus]